MKGKIINFFAGGNTAEGFYSLFKFLSWKAESVYIIKGGPGTGKSTFMKNLGEAARMRGLDIEKHWCSSDNDSLDGIVIPALNTALIDGTAPHLIDPIYPGAVENIIDLGKYWNQKYLRSHKEEIIVITNTIAHNFKKAYLYLNLAGKLIRELDDEQQTFPRKLTALEKKIKSKIFSSKYITRRKARHLFARAYTPGGITSFYENITEEIEERFLIAGDNSLLISDYLQQIGDLALNEGLHTLYLHSPLLPARIEAVIIFDINIAVINLKPESQIISRETDKHYILAENYKYPQEINKEKKLAEQFIATALENLKNAKTNHDRLEEYYCQAMDFSGVNRLQEQFRENILKNL